MAGSEKVRATAEQVVGEAVQAAGRPSNQTLIAQGHTVEAAVDAGEAEGTDSR